MLRASVVTTSLILAGSFVFFADAGYPVVAKTLHLRTAHPAVQSATVQLIIRAKPDILPEVLADLQTHQVTASVALIGTRSPEQLEAVEAAGDQVLANLEPGSRIGWVHTRRVLKAQVADSDDGAVKVYLPPREGLTLSEYLLARSAGAVPLKGMIWVRYRHPATKPLQAGGIVVLDLESSRDPAVPLLEELLGQLQAQGLTAVPLAVTSAPAGTPAG
jgi:hypothetical protein